jgi:hypothetical protein
VPGDICWVDTKPVRQRKFGEKHLKVNPDKVERAPDGRW